MIIDAKTNLSFKFKKSQMSWSNKSLFFHPFVEKVKRKGNSLMQKVWVPQKIQSAEINELAMLCLLWLLGKSGCCKIHYEDGQL